MLEINHIPLTTDWELSLQDLLTQISGISPQEAEELSHRLISEDFVIDETAGFLVERLSDMVREKFPEVAGIVLLGSNTHGGAVLRKLTYPEGAENSTADLDLGLILNQPIDNFILMDIGQFIGTALPAISADNSLPSPQFDLHALVKYTIEQPQNAEELFEFLAFVTKLSTTKPDYVPDSWYTRLITLLLQPSFPPEVNIGNRQLVFEALSRIYKLNPEIWEEIVSDIMQNWETMHSLKLKHFGPLDNEGDRLAAQKLAEGSGAIMASKLLTDLENTRS